jgi:nucleotide-binding universal stress UspA family protein
LEYRRILIALDGEIESEVVDAALALSELLPVTPSLELLRVVEPAVPVLTRLAVQPVHFGADWTQRRETEARTYLAHVADRLRARGIDAAIQVLVGRPVYQQILRYGGAAADLIVLGTHGAHGLERLALGSVADKVIRQGDLPLLIAPVRRRSTRATP